MPHCGACGKKLGTGKEWAIHIKNCKAAAITLEAVEVIAKTDGLSTVGTSIPAAELVDELEDL